MLSKCSKGQPVAYNILKNAINKKMVGHAFLFYADSVSVAYDVALNFAKTLICPQNKLEQNECGNCTICHRIDNNNFMEIKIIRPEGLWIKKDQLITLQDQFRMKALEVDKKVYIINEAEKLNVQAANSILKFLEEPEPNIIAILTTSDIRKVLPTIISRCQIISLNANGINDNEEIVENYNKTLKRIGAFFYKDRTELQKFVADEKNVEKLEAIIAFVRKYEVLKTDALLETRKLWFDNFIEREDNIWAFDVMIFLYKDVLNFMYKRELEMFDNYIGVIEFIANNNNIKKIIYKLQKILAAKEKIKYNINLNLLVDKLIIEMESGEHV
ncbi:MAG: hypothetical protein PHE29_13585 [Tissierellia bacterium]|nr:hypothetical protein [Tissierellia bacterium]